MSNTDDSNKKNLPQKEFTEVAKTLVDALNNKTEIEKTKIQANEKKDQLIHQIHLEALKTKERITEQLFKDRSKHKILIAVIAILTTVFLIACLITKQISFFVPLFHDAAWLFMGAFGGYGIRAVKEKDRNQDDQSK